MSTPFWFKDISILYNKNYLLEIIPKKEYDFNRKLNAVVRFTIYYAILLYIFRKDKNILCLPFITIVITVFLHRTSKNESQGNAMDNLMNITDKTGNLVAMKVVTDEDDLMIINKSGIAIRMHVADLRTQGRATQGVSIFKIPEGDKIVYVSRIQELEN